MTYNSWRWKSKGRSLHSTLGSWNFDDVGRQNRAFTENRDGDFETLIGKIEKANKNWKLKTKKMKNLKIESWLVGQSGTISWRRKKRPQNEKLKKQIEIGNWKLKNEQSENWKLAASRTNRNTFLAPQKRPQNENCHISKKMKQIWTRGAFFAWRAPILSWPRIMCSQVRMLKFLEPSWEMP